MNIPVTNAVRAIFLDLLVGDTAATWCLLLDREGSLLISHGNADGDTFNDLNIDWVYGVPRINQLVHQVRLN